MATSSPASSSSIRSVGARVPRLSDRAIGILIISLVPSLMWMGLIAAGGWALGAAIPFYGLALTGAGIALFLAAVATALTARA